MALVYCCSLDGLIASIVLLICTSLWIKASAKWLNVNVAESLQNHSQVPHGDMRAYRGKQPQRTAEKTSNQGVFSHRLTTKRGVVSSYGRHLHLQGGLGQPCGESSLQELQHWTNRAVNWFELVISAPRSEKPPLQGIQFPRWGSSGLDDGLNNLSWETESYELCPLRGHTHSQGRRYGFWAPWTAYSLGPSCLPRGGGGGGMGGGMAGYTEGYPPR